MLIIFHNLWVLGREDFFFGALGVVVPSWGSKQFGDTTRLRSPHLKRDLSSQIVEAVTYWCGDLIDFYSSPFF